MKFFAVSSEGGVLTLVFSDEDKMENAFNESTGTITDSTNKTYKIDTSYGYSRDISDFSFLAGRNIKKINPILEKDMQGDM